MQLYEISPVARKLWVKKKWDEYQNTKLCEVIKKAVKLYEEPQDQEFDDMLDKGKWKATIDRKVNYLLGRAPTCTDGGEGNDVQDKFDKLASLIRESAKGILLRGSLIWCVQGDGASLDPVPSILYDAISVYEDAEKETVFATIRKYVTVDIDKATGAESEIEMFECYYKNAEGKMIRDTFCYSNPQLDKSETLEDWPVFIDVGKTGTAPLFAYGARILYAFDNTLKHQDETTKKNTKPLVEVRGYSGTDDEDLSYAVDELAIVKTDGTGGVTIHSRTMDSAAIDTWQKRLLLEWNEVMSVVGKENELQYAVSGKAMDRLFVDMENSAQELGHTIGEALKEYFALLGIDVDIVWNTDRPTDDAATISAIAQSRGIVSERTLLEQHPWVSDVDEELERLEAEKMDGFEDLLEPEHEEDEENGL